MTARPINWNEKDISELVSNPTYPWMFVSYKTVKPTEWYFDKYPGDANPIVKISTEYNNIPTGYVPVSPVVEIESGNSREASHYIQDDELVPFIRLDSRFCTLPDLTSNLRSDGADGPANAWGCQFDADPYQGVRLMRMLLEGSDYCSLGDQQVPSNFNPGRMCEVLGWANYYRTTANSPPKIYAVHRHLVHWDNNPWDGTWWSSSKGHQFIRRGGQFLRVSSLVRLNKTMALFRVDYLNRDGNNARPITLRNILNFSINNDDSAEELSDRGKLNKSQIDLSATQDNAVETYRKYFCLDNPNGKECACFRSIPKELKFGLYDIVCHDAQCKTYGYKPSAALEGKTCTPLSLQICTQSLAINGNENSSVVANLRQECSTFSGGTRETQTKTQSETTPLVETKESVDTPPSVLDEYKWYILLAVILLILCIVLVAVL